jgi:hypothetical protein
MNTWSGNMRYRLCEKITAIVILMSFLTIRGYGEPPTAALNGYTGSGMRLYNETEVQGMIDELAEVAEEAIETVAAEAAKAAVMASLEREAAALAEAQRVRGEYAALNAALKSRLARTAILTGAVCFLSGFVIGVVTIR